jgi:hypothetical protein
MEQQVQRCLFQSYQAVIRLIKGSKSKIANGLYVLPQPSG